MTTLAATRPDASLKQFLYISLIVHLTFGALVALDYYFSDRGASWGGPGGSITVGLVGNVPAIPLPRPDVVSDNRVVDESKGLFKSEPAAPPKPPPDAVPIPKFEKNKPPKYISKLSKVLENPTPPPQNAIPYGGGGTPTIPTTSFAIGPGNTQAGMAFSGMGGGDFGSRFTWYVDAVQRRHQRAHVGHHLPLPCGGGDRLRDAPRGGSDVHHELTGAVSAASVSAPASLT